MVNMFGILACCRGCMGGGGGTDGSDIGMKVGLRYFYV